MSAKPNTIYRNRLWFHRIGLVFSFAAMAIGLFFLTWILLTLVAKGLGSVNVAMFTESTPGPGANGGGLCNAIVGSLMIVGLSTLMSTPIGIMAGIYLAEYGDRSHFAKMTRFMVDIMLSAPSIVIGMFVYTLYVAHTKHFSGWAGSFAISLIAIPVVVRTTDNMLNMVPVSLREAAFALGTPQWKVSIMIRLRAVRTGILTGVLLAGARIMGETAPLFFTALNNQFYSTNMDQPMANMPVVIYQFAMSPYDNWRALAWGGSLMIAFGVLGLNILSRSLFSQKKAN